MKKQWLVCMLAVLCILLCACAKQTPERSALTPTLMSVASKDGKNCYSVCYANDDGTPQYTCSLSLPTTYAADNVTFTSKSDEIPEITLAETITVDELPRYDKSGKLLSAEYRFSYAVGTVLNEALTQKNGVLLSHFYADLNGKLCVIYSGKGASYFYVAFLPIDTNLYAPVVFSGDLSILQENFSLAFIESVLENFEEVSAN